MIRCLLNAGPTCFAPSGLPLLLHLFPGLAPWAFLRRPFGAGFTTETNHAPFVTVPNYRSESCILTPPKVPKKNFELRPSESGSEDREPYPAARACAQQVPRREEG